MQSVTPVGSSAVLGVIIDLQPTRLWLLDAMILCLLFALYQLVCILIEEYGIDEKCRRKRHKRPSKSNNSPSGNLSKLRVQSAKSGTTSHHLFAWINSNWRFKFTNLFSKLINLKLKLFGFPKTHKREMTPNGQKLSYRRTATLNNQKTHSQNRSANRRLAPALC